MKKENHVKRGLIIMNIPAIKLIAMDLDGTLLSDEKDILASSIYAIERARAAGILVTVVTGRPFISAKRYIDKITTDIPGIFYNGARIIDPTTGRTDLAIDLEPEDARRILELANALDVTACVWSSEKLYTNKIEGNIHTYKKLSRLEPLEITDIDLLLNQGIAKIIWYDEAPRVRELRGLAMSEKFKSLTACVSDPEYLEFFNSRVDKGRTLELLCRQHGINISEVAAIGDGENDISMLERAGLGIAMENGAEQVKACANFITASNNNHGIAKAIDMIISENNRGDK